MIAYYATLGIIKTELKKKRTKIIYLTPVKYLAVISKQPKVEFIIYKIGSFKYFI